LEIRAVNRGGGVVDVKNQTNAVTLSNAGNFSIGPLLFINIVY